MSAAGQPSAAGPTPRPAADGPGLRTVRLCLLGFGSVARAFCALLLREERAEGARHAPEAQQAEADGAEVGGRRLPGRAHRTDRDRSPTAVTNRSSSPCVVYGARPTRIRPPRLARPSNSTRRAA